MVDNIVRVPFGTAIYLSTRSPTLTFTLTFTPTASLYTARYKGTHS